MAKAIEPDMNFDWESYENGSVLTDMSKDELEKKYDETLNSVKSADVVAIQNTEIDDIVK